MAVEDDRQSSHDDLSPPALVERAKHTFQGDHGGNLAERFGSHDRGQLATDDYLITLTQTRRPARRAGAELKSEDR